jgi:hypothetical protein
MKKKKQKKLKINLTKELEDMDFSGYEILSKMKPNDLAERLTDLLELHKLSPTKENIYKVARILESDLREELMKDLEDLDFSNYEILSKMEPNYVGGVVSRSSRITQITPDQKNIYTVATILESDLMHEFCKQKPLSND